MLCANKFCFFNTFGKCSKNQIEIDITGHCKSYRYIHLNHEELAKIKEEQNDHFIEAILKESKDIIK